jgi:hypothetical protein
VRELVRELVPELVGIGTGRDALGGLLTDRRPWSGPWVGPEGRRAGAGILVWVIVRGRMIPA